MCEVFFTGTNGRGALSSGRSEGDSPSAVAQRLFNDGWRSATIRRNGNVVGGIWTRDGRREFWGDRATTAPPARDEVLEQEMFDQFRDLGLDDDEAREAARQSADLAAAHG